MPERRRYPRLEAKLPVTLRHQGRFIPATLLNISCGGVRIIADDSIFSLTTPVEMIFDLDESHRDVSLRGRITRATSGPMGDLGIQFSNLFSESHRAVEDFLKQHLN